MQLNSHRNVRAVLVTATCALLGQAGSGVQADPGDWTFDSALLYYTEKDRVSAIEPVFQVRREMLDDATLDFKLVFDALTGASANGAMPGSQVQTFTRPSGNGTYDIAPGETPLDDTFHDTRGAFSANWTRWLNSSWKMTLGGNVSSEYDFQSVGANILFARDFNRRNTTMSFGLSLEADSIDPVGGLPTPLARMATTPADGIESSVTPGVDEDDFDVRASSDSKSVTDLLVGVTQVLGRNGLLQLNYTYSQSDGYLTDPYKLVSVMDTDPATLGEPLHHLYESRPDVRAKHGLYAGAKWWFDGDILNASYRYMTDDWGIDSHTVDVRYRFAIGNASYIEPHLRYYTQSAADFYRRALLETDVLPEIVSADYRLGDLDGTTLGVQYGTRIGKGELRVRVERYLQSGTVEDRVNIGVQRQHELFPDVEANIVQFSYSFGF